CSWSQSSTRSLFSISSGSNGKRVKTDRRTKKRNQQRDQHAQQAIKDPWEDDVDLKLTGKIALVTGSTAGIGFAIAKSLASEGAHVYVNGRTQVRVNAAVAGIRSRAGSTKVGGIPAEMVNYGMTKTAQIAVARGIAESVAGTGVTINTILAGPTESEGVSGFVEAMAKQQNKSKKEMENDFFEHARPSSLLKRFATVDEVAAMATYVAGQLSSATNGAALRVDGGVVRAIL